MTTIAYDGCTVACDGRSELYDIIVSTTAKKIRVHFGTVYACAGAPQMYDRVIAWLHARDWSEPAPTAPEGKWSIMILSRRPNGAIVLEYASSEVPYPAPMQAPLALGSGCQFAMGAMKHGASAREAVEIACSLDPYSGGEVQVVDIAEALGLSNGNLKAEPVKEAAE